MILSRRDEHSGEARAIVDALHRLKSSPELVAISRIDLHAALDRLGLTGTPRRAVAATLALTPATGTFFVPGFSVFWSFQG
jgi:hypothetical protein